jgi:hypothetical protein
VSATRAERSAARLLRLIGLRPDGPVSWGLRVGFDEPGVYLVEVPEATEAAPMDEAAVRAWIERVPSLRLDGARPTPRELTARLAKFWVPGESVVYVGLASTSVAKRVRQFYRTPLGDRRPHAGGHWIRTLACRDGLLVSWAAADVPHDAEAALLGAFADLHEGALPFANRQSAGGVRKSHGISGSALAGGTPAALPSGPVRAPRPTARGNIAQINAALAALASAQPDGETDAVSGGAELERLGLLTDSASRPGKPLRDLLRAGLIVGAYQDGSRRWHIPSPRGRRG